MWGLIPPKDLKPLWRIEVAVASSFSIGALTGMSYFTRTSDFHFFIGGALAMPVGFPCWTDLALLHSPVRKPYRLAPGLFFGASRVGRSCLCFITVACRCKLILCCLATRVTTRARMRACHGGEKRT